MSFLFVFDLTENLYNVYSCARNVSKERTTHFTMRLSVIFSYHLTGLWFWLIWLSKEEYVSLPSQTVVIYSGLHCCTDAGCALGYMQLGWWNCRVSIIPMFIRKLPKSSSCIEFVSMYKDDDFLSTWIVRWTCTIRFQYTCIIFSYSLCTDTCVCVQWSVPYGKFTTKTADYT